MLPMLKEAAERRWRVEGDDILSDAHAQLTHATTIDAPPGDVWPWLLQMGCQRAGWYSWDALDNAGLRSADRIIPELQHLAVGDVLPGPAGRRRRLQGPSHRAETRAGPGWHVAAMDGNVGGRAAAARLEQHSTRHPLPCLVPAEHTRSNHAARTRGGAWRSWSASSSGPSSITRSARTPQRDGSWASRCVSK